jgi:hypothetical protein
VKRSNGICDTVSIMVNMVRPARQNDVLTDLRHEVVCILENGRRNV